MIRFFVFLLSTFCAFAWANLPEPKVLENASPKPPTTLEQKFTDHYKKYIPNALYIKPIADNQMAALVISQRELTRIFVANDRILAARGVDGAYLLNKDENAGEIFIKPTALFQTHSINLFITTEKGHSYTLLLVPANIPARAIELRPLDSTKLAEHWEKDGSYSELVVSLIGALAKQQAPDGYAVIVPQKKPLAKEDKVIVTLDKIYRGKYLRGEILVIENRTSQTLTLNEAQFYQVGTRAIALLNTNLFPHATTLLYRVMSND